MKKKEGKKFSHTSATSSGTGTSQSHTKYAPQAKTQPPHRVGKKSKKA